MGFFDVGPCLIKCERIAFDLLRDGTTQAIAVGSVDVLSATRRQACADMQSQGEASVTLMLETADSASRRNARPLAQLLGASLAPTAEAAIQRALQQAGLTQDTVETVSSPAPLCGDVQGATTLLHLCLTLLAERTTPCLILTSAPEQNTHVAIIVVGHTDDTDITDLHR